MSTTISMDENSNPDAIKTVRDGLSRFNHPYAGDDSYTPISIFLRDENGAVIGGLLGGTYWGWLHIDILWLDDSLRRQGYGSKLLALAEDEGRRRGCKNAHLDTMSFQALGFYQKHGYTVWGTLEGIPEGHDRIYLRKTLG
jgi:GNAT superfamily N-acetyltransferase